MLCITTERKRNRKQDNNTDVMAGLLCWLLDTLTQNTEIPRRSKYNTVLPKCCHAELTAEMLGNRPVLVIGDVHGCLEELRHLLRLANSKHQNTFVIFVGDMVNKGPDNMNVLRLIQRMIGDGQAAAVRGNHEESILRVRDRCAASDSYTLPERYNWLHEMRQNDYAFLEELPYTISIPSHHAMIVHAGFIPGIPLERQSLADMTHMRNIFQEDYFEGHGLVGSNKHSTGEPWGSLWPGPEHVYFGHDAKRGLQKWPHATGLDTGCLYGHALTGAFVGHSGGPLEILSVTARAVYVVPDDN